MRRQQGSTKWTEFCCEVHTPTRSKDLSLKEGTRALQGASRALALRSLHTQYVDGNDRRSQVAPDLGPQPPALAGSETYSYCNRDESPDDQTPCQVSGSVCSKQQARGSCWLEGRGGSAKKRTARKGCWDVDDKQASMDGRGREGVWGCTRDHGENERYCKPMRAMLPVQWIFTFFFLLSFPRTGLGRSAEPRGCELARPRPSEFSPARLQEVPIRVSVAEKNQLQPSSQARVDASQPENLRWEWLEWVGG